MHIWKVNNSALIVTSGPLRPHVFGSRLYFRDNAGVHDVSGTAQSNGTVTFNVGAAQVSTILSKQGFLFLTTRHVLHVGSPDLRWGWRYKLAQGGAHLTAVDGTGAPLPLDPQGFFNSPLEPLDEPVELSRETIAFA